MKDALPGEQSTFLSLSFPELLYLALPTHTLKTVYISLWLVRHWYIIGQQSNFHLYLRFQWTEFLKISYFSLPRIRQKLDSFSSKWSIIKGSLLREQSTFSSASLLPFEWFSWNFKSRRVHIYTANNVTVLVIGQQWTVSYLQSKVSFYLPFHSRDFSWNLIPLMCYKQHNFVCDPSIMKATLLGEQVKFSAVSQLQCSWKFIFKTLQKCATHCISLVAVH